MTDEAEQPLLIVQWQPVGGTARDVAHVMARCLATITTDIAQGGAGGRVRDEAGVVLCHWHIETEVTWSDIRAAFGIGQPHH